MSSLRADSSSAASLPSHPSLGSQISQWLSFSLSFSSGSASLGAAPYPSDASFRHAMVHEIDGHRVHECRKRLLSDVRALGSASEKDHVIPSEHRRYRRAPRSLPAFLELHERLEVRLLEMSALPSFYEKDVYDASDEGRWSAPDGGSALRHIQGIIDSAFFSEDDGAAAAPAATGRRRARTEPATAKRCQSALGRLQAPLLKAAAARGKRRSAAGEAAPAAARTPSRRGSLRVRHARTSAAAAQAAPESKGDEGEERSEAKAGRGLEPSAEHILRDGRDSTTTAAAEDDDSVAAGSVVTDGGGSSWTGPAGAPDPLRIFSQSVAEQRRREAAEPAAPAVDVADAPGAEAVAAAAAAEGGHGAAPAGGAEARGSAGSAGGWFGFGHAKERHRGASVVQTVLKALDVGLGSRGPPRADGGAPKARGSLAGNAGAAAARSVDGGGPTPPKEAVAAGTAAAEGGGGEGAEAAPLALELLRGAKGGGLPKWVDASRKEAYLSKDDFAAAFGIDAAQFRELPGWRKDELRRNAGLL